MGTNTIRLHRVFRAAPERINRAFLDADVMTKWLPPNGFTGPAKFLLGEPIPYALMEPFGKFRVKENLADANGKRN